jgi:hypothetical protein
MTGDNISDTSSPSALGDLPRQLFVADHWRTKCHTFNLRTHDSMFISSAAT